MLIEWAIGRAVKKGIALPEDEPDSVGLRHDVRASECTSSNWSVFAKNASYMDICGQFEYMRGLLGAAVLLIPGAILWGFADASSWFILDWVRGTTEGGQSYGWDHNFAGIFIICMTLGILWLFRRFAWPLLNKDYFTTRRVLIRFNRVTRKVYIHRPAYAGGVATFDWDLLYGGLDDKGGVNQPGDGRLMACWSDTTSKKMIGFVFLGRAAGNAENGKAWWEYIRRYMEDGADSVPKPFPRLWRGAWPQTSLIEMFYLYPERILHGGPLWWIALLILAPVNLLRAVLHWIAMLLCVEPKFPPEIENAGKPLVVKK